MVSLGMTDYFFRIGFIVGKQTSSARLKIKIIITQSFMLCFYTMF